MILAVRRPDLKLVNNGHTFTSHLYAYISYSFYASAIYYYGTLDYLHGNYTITVDGANATIVSAAANQYTSPVCLFSRTGLDLARPFNIPLLST